MANGFRQLTPEEINQESIREVTPPWEILGGLYGTGALARGGFRALAPLLARRMAQRAPLSAPGRLAELARTGQIDRPWPGIYKGPASAGRTQPISYARPNTYELPESADELADLIRQLGGTAR